MALEVKESLFLEPEVALFDSSLSFFEDAVVLDDVSVVAGREDVLVVIVLVADVVFKVVLLTVVGTEVEDLIVGVTVADGFVET